MDEKNEIHEKFFQLKTREDVAELLGIKERSLRYFLYKIRPEYLYHSFEIPKKDGTYRKISAPVNKWKQVQKKLALILSEVYEPKICAYGFIKEKNILGNASQHARRVMVFNIDLDNFFTQIHFGRVRGMLMKPPYSLGEEAATTIAQIACVKGVLPQGAPSSPIITNMICTPLDNALMKLAKKEGCVYTRYADDITFSTYKREFGSQIVYVDNQGIHLGEELTSILRKNSFSVNLEKIILRSRSERQEVTGLTVNEFPNLRRNYIKQLRAILHSCEKYGVYNAAKVYVNKGYCKNDIIRESINKPESEAIVVAWFKSVLTGKIYYIRQIKGSDSPTYLTFAKKLNEIFSEKIFDVSALDNLETLVRENTFVLQMLVNGATRQGSGFYVKNLGLLTCYHVTESTNLFGVYSYKNDSGEIKVPLDKRKSEISSDKNIDYSLYNMGETSSKVAGFAIGDSSQLKLGQQIIIVGYPEYNIGDSPFIQTCNITSEKYFLGTNFFTVSGRIAHGMSGGVVLNTDLEAIGIIKGGIVSLNEDDNSNVNQGFIPIHLAINHIKEFDEI